MCRNLKTLPKRTNFARIQLDAWMSAVGHQALPVRTSFELIQAHRSGELYALISEQEGVVNLVDDKQILISYKDGTTKSYGLGRSYGTYAGKDFPRSLVSDRKKGYKFGVGEVLAWDEFFFYRDWIETTQVSVYTGVPAIVGMCETPDTYEDGCGISSKFAPKLGSNITHTRDMMVNFDESIEVTIKEGSHVESEDALARILPAGVDPAGMVELSIDYLSTTSPRAKYPGTVERIEVFYCGDKTEASESVRKVINLGDRTRGERAKVTGDFASGYVEQPTYLSQNYVGKNTCLIRVYITHQDILGVGDKIAFANALKTVPGLIYDTIYKTVDGLEIDAKFSYKGVMARIVKSPEYMGLINMIMRQIGLNACKLYRGVKL